MTIFDWGRDWGMILGGTVPKGGSVSIDRLGQLDWHWTVNLNDFLRLSEWGRQD